jgi:hypothetical protein
MQKWTKVESDDELSGFFAREQVPERHRRIPSSLCVGGAAAYPLMVRLTAVGLDVRRPQVEASPRSHRAERRYLRRCHRAYRRAELRHGRVPSSLKVWARTARAYKLPHESRLKLAAERWLEAA